MMDGEPAPPLSEPTLPELQAGKSTRLASSETVHHQADALSPAARVSARLAAGGVLLFWAWAVWVLAHYYVQLWRLVGSWGWARPYFHGDRTLPYLSEAALRAITGVGAAGLLVAAAAGVGWWAGSRLGWAPLTLSTAVPFSAALGLGLFAYLGLGLALVGFYRPWVLNTLVVVAAVLTLAAALRAVRRGWACRDDHNRAEEGLPTLKLWRLLRCYISPRRILSRPWLSRDRLWQAAAALAVGMAFAAALAPEREYDALWYHLQYPRLFLEQGRLVDNPTDYVSLYPMTWELWYGYGLALGGQTAATLLHFAALPLTAMVVYALARRYVPGASPWLAVALFTTIPTVMWEASTAYIDLGLALHVSLVVYALLRYSDPVPDARQSGKRSAWLLLAAANLGLALAAKHLSLVVLGLACLGLFVRLASGPGGWKRAFGAAAVLGSLALLPALPWYLRSAAASGNPFFPELYSLFGAPANRWDAATQAGLDQFLEGFGRERTFLNLLGLPWHMTVHAAAYHGALGPLFLIMLPVLLLGRLRGASGWLLAFCGLFAAVWASPLASFQMRFLVPITPFLAVLGSVAFTRLAAAARLARRSLRSRLLPIKGTRIGQRAFTAPLTGLVAVLLLLNLPPFTALHEVDRVEWDGWLNSVLHGVEWEVVIGAESQDAYLARQVRSYRVWQVANQLLPPDAYVLTWSGGDQFYSNHRRLWVHSVATRPLAVNDFQTPEDLLPRLRAAGITHLIPDVDFRQRLEGQGGALPGPFELLFEDRFYSLYRVRSEGQP